MRKNFAQQVSARAKHLREFDADAMNEIAARYSKTITSASMSTSSAFIPDEGGVTMEETDLDFQTAPEGAFRSAADDESIVRDSRPVLKVLNGFVDITTVALDTWRSKILEGVAGLKLAIGGVGRIELRGDPTLTYAGTGWLITDEIIVTNRHVAEYFAHRSGKGFSFRMGVGQRMSAQVDFIEEFGISNELEAPVVEILYVAEESEPDVAFLRIANSTLPNPPQPLVVGAHPSLKSPIAVIGYPTRDYDFPNQELMKRLFGDIYEKKRLAPGYVTGARPDLLLHDCSTLRGNSGSPVVSLSTGEVVGLHFQGIFEVANRAVPAIRVGEMLDDALRSRRRRTRSTPEANTPLFSKGSYPMSEGYTFTVPLQITVRIGDTPEIKQSTDTQSLQHGITSANEIDALAEAERILGSHPNIVSIDRGWRYADGLLTNDRAIVVSVREKLAIGDLQRRGMAIIPSTILGIPVDVQTAGPDEYRSEEFDFLTEAPGGPARYKLPPHLSLKEVDEDMFLFCHASPDAGWPSLSYFLERTKERLTIGMYELTAPHVFQKLLSVLPAPRTLELAIQGSSNIGSGTKDKDLDEEKVVVPELKRVLGQRFTHQWVPIGRRTGLVPNSYHIKVAIRDGEAVWLSSGSWQSSNQPEIEPANENETSTKPLEQYNREWSIILVHSGLAQTLEEYIRWDIKQSRELKPTPEAAVFFASAAELEAVEEAPTAARYFDPLTVHRRVRVKPILTPDGYWRDVVSLIESAQERLYFQNQSLNLVKDQQSDHFRMLLDALLDAQDRVDLRIIVRGEYFRPLQMSRLKDYGFDLSKVRYQDKCHNKGILVDGRRVLVGSHNWTNMGTAWNRDASLIIDDEEIAGYFEQIFEFDWTHVARKRNRRDFPAVVKVEPGAEVPEGFVPLPI